MESRPPGLGTGNCQNRWFHPPNAGVGIGERVNIKRAEFEPATHISTGASGRCGDEYGDHIREIIKKKHTKRPFVVGDVIPIISSMTQPMATQSSGGQAIPLIAVEANHTI
jgi:transitional endoplasmic reticulum ATPase